MRKVPITVVDLYDVCVFLKDIPGSSIKLEFQSKELQVYPSNDVMSWSSVTGEMFSINVRNLLYVRQIPIKSHIEEVEVP